ncbi:hypothetical protein N5079_16495 [Planotetraspora sp. A-T 1434]|uniref:hypothetical protein n=1 Tax=Planotetraspora sp. A-T 1434 TaxID=2979219 RepID=UPI0021C05E31|nr:hypothetical protein [Planotetraspora sp. A-T 1434]MCT9931813.1 hypothetical protein [Planotetraspora sp. A-T 1434]
MSSEEPLPGLIADATDSADAILYEGRGHLLELDMPCSVTVTMEWFPRHQIKVSLTSDQSESRWLQLHKIRPFRVRLEDLDGSNNTIEVYHRRSAWNMATAWLAERTIMGQASSPVNQISGSLVNFVSTLGSPLATTSQRESWAWAGRQQWVVDGWEITIDARPDLSPVLEGLGESGGFARTHAIRVRKADSTEFVEANVAEVMEALHLSLSFLIGRYFAPVYGGRDSKGDKVWEEWSCPKVDQLTQGRQELWNVSMGVELEEVAVPLMHSFLTPSRRSAMSFLTQAYLGANGTALLEQRVLLAVAAIEHLAWIRLVHEQGMDPKKVDSEKADWRVRRLLSDAGISIFVPKHLPALAAYAKAQGGDAAKAVAEVRHNLTHPKNPSDIYLHKGLLRESWLILSHWLGLLIFSWVGYKGRVIDTSNLNRWSGDTIPMPQKP